MSASKFQKAVISILKSVIRPATIDEISEMVAAQENMNVEETRIKVKEMLAGGIEFGFIGKMTKEEYINSEVNADDDAAKTTSLRPQSDSGMFADSVICRPCNCPKKKARSRSRPKQKRTSKAKPRGCSKSRPKPNKARGCSKPRPKPKTRMFGKPKPKTRPFGKPKSCKCSKPRPKSACARPRSH